MKRTGLLILLLISTILFSQFGCVADDSTTLAVDALRKRLNDSDALIATHTTTIAQLTAQLAQKASAAEVAAAKADAATALAKANTMTTPPANNYESRIAALEAWKTSLATTNPTTPGTPTPVTGQVNYTIQNPQQFYQFGTPLNISIRLFNNKSDARYVRPQITATTYQSMSGGNVVLPPVGQNPPPNPIPAGYLGVYTYASVISNSQGQAPILPTVNAVPATGTNEVTFSSYNGGIANGRYLLGSGSYIDIIVQIQIISNPAVTAMWVLSVTGTDTSLTGQ